MNFDQIVTIVVAAGAVHGFVLSALLGFSRRGNPRANRIMAVLVLLLALGMAATVYVAGGFFRRFPHLIGLSLSLPFTYGPLLYLYVRALTGGEAAFSRRDWRHFSLYFLSLALVAPVFFLPGEVKIRYAEEWYFRHSGMDRIGIVIGTAWAFFYGFLALRRLRKHAAAIRRSYSTLERINLNWLRYLLGAYLVIWSTVAVLFGGGLAGHGWIVPDDLVIYLLTAVLLFTIAYLGMSQPEIFAAADPVEERRYGKSTLPATTAEEIERRLHHCMTSERPWLDPDLTLAALAGRLDISMHHLSQVINERMNLNFFRYINGFRVEEAKRRLTAAAGREKVLTVALAVGFRSLSTFNRVFKEVTGRSPSQFRADG